jgi:purine-binding chemotaxis protein CheW
LTSTPTTEDGLTRSLLFRVGDRLYACAIDAVREVVPFRGAVRLPGAPEFVQGLINLRGTVVTVVDFGGWLDPGRPLAGSGSVIIVDAGGRLTGVSVDEVREVRVIESEPLADVVGDKAAVLRGMGRIGETVVLLVDIHALVRLVLD